MEPEQGEDVLRFGFNADDVVQINELEKRILELIPFTQLMVHPEFLELLLVLLRTHVVLLDRNISPSRYSVRRALDRQRVRPIALLRHLCEENACFRKIREDVPENRVCCRATVCQTHWHSATCSMASSRTVPLFADSEVVIFKSVESSEQFAVDVE